MKSREDGLETVLDVSPSNAINKCASFGHVTAETTTPNFKISDWYTWSSGKVNFCRKLVAYGQFSIDHKSEAIIGWP